MRKAPQVERSVYEVGGIALVGGKARGRLAVKRDDDKRKRLRPPINKPEKQAEVSRNQRSRLREFVDDSSRNTTEVTRVVSGEAAASISRPDVPRRSLLSAVAVAEPTTAMSGLYRLGLTAKCGIEYVEPTDGHLQGGKNTAMPPTSMWNVDVRANHK